MSNINDNKTIEAKDQQNPIRSDYIETLVTIIIATNDISYNKIKNKNINKTIKK